MIDAVEGKPDDLIVHIDARAFRKLGELLQSLANLAESCADDDSFARPVNGVRTWVPARTLDDRIRHSTELARENLQLREALRTIVEHPRGIWGTPVQRLQSIAREALEPPGGEANDHRYDSG